MENFYYFDFGEILPTTLYYNTGSSAQFWSNFKNLTFFGLSSKIENFLVEAFACFVGFPTKYA